MKESDLYPPVKAFLEAQGYEVKGEIGPADVVGLRGGEQAAGEMVVVELKTRFSLALFHQGIARLAVCDCVYVCVARGKGRPWMKAVRENVKLARRLGLGLLSVRMETGAVEVHCDPGPYAPRKVARKTRAILSEFERRDGDPNLGGLAGARVTAYRQEATLCAEFLALAGEARGAEVAKSTGVARATTIMRDNHYGWFEKVAVGVYRLSDAGRDVAPSG
ncbi:DUF2161 domain-containing phosphodiesterase [Gymnodinialimonas ulvae]|uniref:DUF2161 domain-containing phosphodiesterase n=1 Tax=Gymnodinialimonas ulvae TaxID=3126504 RepID=UPI00309A5825